MNGVDYATKDPTVTTIEQYTQEIVDLDMYDQSKGPVPIEIMYVLGLVGEAGEIADKIKKVYRDNDGVYSLDVRAAIILELGDCLWYLTRLSKVFGVSLIYVATENLRKLFGRRVRGTQRGSGDNR